ncbi:MAG TPA: arginase family protein [Solirubrobacteraceae bacterium]|nr:arginase family protein [Solirubrobacteraceae bacterium]
MALELIAWPYQDGRADFRMGRGATVLADDDQLRSQLRAEGRNVSVERVAAVDENRPEVARVIELDRRLARQVRRARARGAFPLVLAGNCNSCLGTVAGVGPDGLGVVWFDAHADFDTPEDNVSGFFDVMGLAILTGTGWQALAHTIPGFAPVAEGNVVLAGVRDLEPYQRARLEDAAIRTAPGAFGADQLEDQLDRLRTDVERVYLHLDLDALDTSVGHANEYAAVGGPRSEMLLRAISAVFERFRVEAAAVTAYDPSYDTDGRIAAAARALIAAIARGAAEQGREAAFPRR